MEIKKLGIANVFKDLVLREIGLVFSLFTFFQVLLWLVPHHDYSWILAKIVIAIAILKIIYILSFSIVRLRSVLESCVSFNEVLYVYALILSVLILSFAVDYYCLSGCVPEAFLFKSKSVGSISLAFDLLYFSIVTFATIGYGDIVPLTIEAKLLVVFEIISSFIMITFVISNVVMSNPGLKRKTGLQ